MPIKEEGHRFLAAVANDLGVSVVELKLLTAVETPLYQFHRIDALIEWQGKVAYVDFKMRNLDSRVAFLVRPSDVDNGFGLIANSIGSFFHSEHGCDNSSLGAQLQVRAPIHLTISERYESIKNRKEVN